MTNTPSHIAGKLTDSARTALLGIYSGFAAGDRFRLDEGEHHAPYTALVKLGMLTKERIGGHYTTYALTPLGLAVRQYLQSGEDHE